MTHAERSNKIWCRGPGMDRTSTGSIRVAGGLMRNCDLKHWIWVRFPSTVLLSGLAWLVKRPNRKARGNTLCALRAANAAVSENAEPNALVSAPTAETQVPAELITGFAVPAQPADITG